MGLSRLPLNEPNSAWGLFAANRYKTPSKTRQTGPVLLLGAPGVGKGTQGETLAKRWRVPKISTGEILRENVASRTDLGRLAERVMNGGGLVSDEMMCEMVSERLGHSDAANGFILDGFPRTIQQAQWLDGYLALHSDAPLGIIYLRMDPERIVERIIDRRVCPQCKTVYNLRLMPPKQMGRCDKDSAALEQRNDDRPEVFQMRLEMFRRETEPLIGYYRRHPLFIEVDAHKAPAGVTNTIAAGLADLRSRLDHI